MGLVKHGRVAPLPIRVNSLRGPAGELYGAVHIPELPYDDQQPLVFGLSFNMGIVALAPSHHGITNHPGRLVIPVGSRYGQYLECWKRQGQYFEKESITPVAFVPLIGQHGWDE